MRLEKITATLSMNLKHSVEDLLRKINCDHDFHGHGFGYKCSKCGYYSGTRDDINNLIEKALNNEEA